jgi:hypothetical protein
LVLDIEGAASGFRRWTTDRFFGAYDARFEGVDIGNKANLGDPVRW